jgi:hypothetical protein
LSLGTSANIASPDRHAPRNAPTGTGYVDSRLGRSRGRKSSKGISVQDETSPTPRIPMSVGNGNVWPFSGDLSVALRASCPVPLQRRLRNDRCRGVLADHLDLCGYFLTPAVFNCRLVGGNRRDPWLTASLPDFQRAGSEQRPGGQSPSGAHHLKSRVASSIRTYPHGSEMKPSLQPTASACSEMHPIPAPRWPSCRGGGK